MMTIVYISYGLILVQDTKHPNHIQKLTELRMFVLLIQPFQSLFYLHSQPMHRGYHS